MDISWIYRVFLFEGGVRTVQRPQNEGENRNAHAELARRPQALSRNFVEAIVALTGNMEIKL